MADNVRDVVRELLPGIGERADRGDHERRVPGESIAELTEAGVFRLLQPRRYGGAEADPLRFYEIVRDVAGVCGSTGWVTAVLGVHPWQLALFPEAAQEELWGATPDALVSSAYAPVGRMTVVDEGSGGTAGYRLTGRWSFSSGCDHATWVLVGAIVVGEDGKPLDFMTVLLPRTDYEIVDVWDTVGLRGTGSNDIVVKDLLVPAHRVLRTYEHSQLRGPGQRINPGPLFRLPFGAVFTTAIANAVVGTVSGSYERYLAAMRDRVRLSLGGGRFAEDQFAQVAVARAASEIDAAVLQLDRNIADLYTAAAEGEIPWELRVRARRDQVLATERALVASDLLFKTAGGHSLRRGNPIERAWRDAHAGSVHVANDVERTLALYGRSAFGLPVEDNLV